MRFIYLHGFASGPSSRKARAFAERFRRDGTDLLVPDLAQGDFERLTISGQLSVLEQLAAGEPVRLIGSSMGGYLAALYASQHREADRVVLLAPAFGFIHRWPNSLGPDRFEQWRDSGYLETFHYAENRPARVWFGLYEDAMQFPQLPDFEQPALIFHGRHDVTVPAELSVEFAQGHPNARLEILDSDHELMDVIDYIYDQASAFLKAG